MLSCVEKTKNDSFEIGDYVVVEGYGPKKHRRVIRVDNIENPYYPYFCEYEGEQPLFKVHYSYVWRKANSYEIENEMEFRKKNTVTSIFSPSEKINLTFPWGSVNRITPKSNNKNKLNRIPLGYQEIKQSHYSITINSQLSNDGKISNELGISYADLLSIFLDFNGHPLPLIIEINENHIFHTTETFFFNKNDCQECINYLNKLMV